MAAPPPANSKKRKQRMIIMGAAGVALLLFLYMRSRQAAATPNATNPADTQAAVNQAVQAQQAQDASMYGYGSYGTGSAGGPGAGVDLTPLTTALSGLSNDIQTLTGADAALPGQIAASIPAPAAAPPSAAAAPPPAVSPVETPTITVNVNGNPAATSTPNQSKQTTPASRPPKPADPAGGGHYTWSGGKWVLIHAVGPGKWAPGPPPKAPVSKTGSTSHKQPVRGRK